MNLKTFTILFLLGILVSCSATYEKNFNTDDEEAHRRYPETGSFRP